MATLRCTPALTPAVLAALAPDATCADIGAALAEQQAEARAVALTPVQQRIAAQAAADIVGRAAWAALDCGAGTLAAHVAVGASGWVTERMRQSAPRHEAVNAAMCAAVTACLATLGYTY